MTAGAVEPVSAYRPFEPVEAAAYAANWPPLSGAAAGGGALSAREVGDGNLNLVFIVSGDGASAVVKQALPYVRLVGESWPLTLDRNRFERQAYEFYAVIVPDLVPCLYHYDDALALFVMEDLSHLELARRALIRGVLPPRLAADVARFSAETVVRSSDFYLSSAAKKEQVARFINPQLCKITEDLVLTDPFYDAATNDFEPALQPVLERLWADEAAQGNIALLRYAFMTRAESLLHGDLHTGSVMASASETKIVDAEFCFYGPMGFDIGMFIANLFLSAAAHRQEGATGRALVQALLDAAREAWTVFHDRAAALLDAAPVWRPPQQTRRAIMMDLLREAAGFAGAEMIRRTVGLAHVADLDSIADRAVRLRAKTAAIETGRRLIGAYRGLDSFEQTLAIVEEAGT